MPGPCGKRHWEIGKLGNWELQFRWLIKIGIAGKERRGPMDRFEHGRQAESAFMQRDTLEDNIVSTMRRYFEEGPVKHRADLEEMITDCVKRYFDGKPATP